MTARQAILGDRYVQIHPGRDFRQSGRGGRDVARRRRSEDSGLRGQDRDWGRRAARRR